MKEVKVHSGQALIDITVQETGDPERLYEVAQLNGLGITDEISAGSVIMVPDYDPELRSLVRMFADPANKPASETGNGSMTGWNVSTTFSESYSVAEDDQVQVEAGQTLIDICIQELGDPERLFELAEMNGIGITDEVSAGSMISIPAYFRDKRDVVMTFRNPALKPASERMKYDSTVVLPEGIEFWGIEIDFEVS